MKLKRLAMALIATGTFVLAPATKAQESFDRTLAEYAAATMKDAAAAAWHTAQRLSGFALGLIGVDYQYGGESPETGLDCSGLVRYVFQQVTGTTLPRTAQEMSRVGDKIGLSDLKPGDLVFFDTRSFAFSHVGIYLGENQFIHAPSRGREVEIATLEKNFWQKRFNGARRLARTMPNLMPALVSEAVAGSVEVIAAPVDATIAASVGALGAMAGAVAAPVEAISSEFDNQP